MTVILEAEGLRLRELLPDDIDTVAGMVGDPEVMAYWPRPLDRAEAAAWIARQRERYRRDGFGHWLLEAVEDGSPLGQAGLLATAVRGRPDVELAYMLRRCCWGRGYATHAGALVLGHAFAVLRVPAVIALIRPVNLPSRRVAARLGFVPGETVDHKGLAHIVHLRSRPESSDGFVTAAPPQAQGGGAADCQPI